MRSYIVELRIGKAADEFPHITLHGVMATIELHGIMVAACHFPHVAQGLASSGLYGLVCYGHTHKPHEEWVEDCLLLNPGEVMGLRSPSQLALVELPQRSVEWISL